MQNNGRIRPRKLSDLMGEPENPEKKPGSNKIPASSEKNLIIIADNSESEIFGEILTPKNSHNSGDVQEVLTTSKKLKEKSAKSRTVSKLSVKELPISQTKIDGFFKSCSKTYEIEKIDLNRAVCRQNKKTDEKLITTTKNTKNKGRGRKRLFDESSEIDAATELSSSIKTTPKKPAKKRSAKNGRNKSKSKSSSKQTSVECINLVSESEDENNNPTKTTDEKEIIKTYSLNVLQKTEATSGDILSVAHASINTEIIMPTANTSKTKALDSENEGDDNIVYEQEENPLNEEDGRLNKIEGNLQEASSPVYISSSDEDNPSTKLCQTNIVTKGRDVSKRSSYVQENIRFSKTPLHSSIKRATAEKMSSNKPFSEGNESNTLNQKGEKAKTRIRKLRPCPPYKVISGTKFAVDAFQFGIINGVTHYFLSHFHADHYIGLTRKFAMPLFCSSITARLLRAFIPLEESFVHEMELNKTLEIDGVEVTAIDANHCPGAVMFVFKLPNGKCTLHTGDFRASPSMESEPIFWNNDINTIYLDTTYISNKYAFCSQDESINNVQLLIEKFREKNEDKKILFICGGYLIGKERMWSSIARYNRLVVWTEIRRYRALRAIENCDYLDLLCEDPMLATMHVISLGKINYFSLVEYFEQYSSKFDVCLAIRPSGWEKNSKPQYRGKINIIGIEYSEHSSYNELQRFVTFLNPQEVISTVPVSGNLMITSKVPQAWYNYTKFPTMHRNFQPSITNYLKPKVRNMLSSQSDEESVKENFLPSQSIQSDEFAELICSKKVSTDRVTFLHRAGEANDDFHDEISMTNFLS